MNSSQFRKNQFKLLCARLSCSQAELHFVLDNIETFYHEHQEKKLNSNGEPKRYKDGTTKYRTITQSTGLLKAIQQQIKTKIFDQHPLPNHLHGSIKGKSNITNAKVHQGKKYRFTTDLKNFFPSMSSSKVYSGFLSMGFTSPASTWLTQLTTFKARLPQGTSTSPFLANLCFNNVDELLLAICSRNGITYTRFVDDLTFSSSTSFKEIIPTLLKTITNAGFRISHRKTSAESQQPITGITVFNNFIDAPTPMKKKAQDETLNPAEKAPYSQYLKNIRRTNSGMKGKAPSP